MLCKATFMFLLHIYVVKQRRDCMETHFVESHYSFWKIIRVRAVWFVTETRASYLMIIIIYSFTSDSEMGSI